MYSERPVACASVPATCWEDRHQIAWHATDDASGSWDFVQGALQIYHKYKIY